MSKILEQFMTIAKISIEIEVYGYQKSVKPILLQRSEHWFSPESTF